jgi:hypothetical protein
VQHPVPWTNARRVTAVHVAAGVLFGITHASMQSALDPAQWLAGLVDYPAGNPYGDYLSSVLNLQTLAAAALLRAGVGEVGISAFFCVAVSVLYLLFWQNVVGHYSRSNVLALLVPQFLLGTGFLLAGLNYEIIIPPGQVTFGPLAIAWGAWAASLLLFRSDGIPLALVALTGLFHPILGAYLGGACALAQVVRREPQWRRAVGLLLGTAACIGLQYALERHYATALAGSFDAGRLLELNLSKHRVPLEWNRTLALALLATLLCALVHRASIGDGPSARFLPAFLIVAAAGFLLAQVNHYPAGQLGTVARLVYASIPARNLNFLELLAAPLAVLAILAAAPWSAGLFLAAWCFQVWGIGGYFATEVVDGHPAHAPLLQFLELPVLVLACALVLRSLFLARPALAFPERAASHRSVRIATAVGPLLLALPCLWFQRQAPERNGYYGNDAVLQLAATQVRGQLAVAGMGASFRTFPQARTRAAILYDIQLAATFAYLHVDPSATLAMVRDVYGIDLLDPSRQGRINQQCDDLDCASVRELFDRRSSEQWRTLGARYHFSHVLVPASWSLDMRSLGSDAQWRLYAVD